MKVAHQKVLFLLFVILSCVSCAGLQKGDIETKLISEMEGNCKKVEIKRDYDQSVYVIEYTGKMSKERCPVALIRAWKDGKLIQEKEVDICGCREDR